ncbi:MAG: hypothetical protein CMI56_03140 [Parcubacteria group bacterium]|nr:hypothetical protein [Parcubacteria group bacterium]|tara:strand:- start:110 stop:898 length:789 start_codon:yes stop_codon:yes gene_type:complete
MDNSPTRLKKEPLVSILMLTYNRAHYLKNAVESVLTQTYKNWELIVIDDGSTDETESIVTSYDDNRITYKKYPENKGLYVRRQESLSHTTGEYVAVLDGDDMWSSPFKLEQQVHFLERNLDHAVVGTFITVIDADGNAVRKDSYQITDQNIRAQLLMRNQFTHSSVLMRKSMLDMTKGYQPTLAEDLDLFLQLGNFGKFGNISEFLTSYRIHSGGTNDYGIKMARALHAIIKKNSHYPHFYIALLKNCLRIFIGQIKSFLTH